MEFVLSYANQQKSWNTAEDIKHVVDDLDNNQGKVTSFYLTGNTMSVVSAEELTEPLSKQSKIQKLLWNDLFTGRGKDQIGAALKAMSLGLMRARVCLVELDLSDNAFGPNGVVGVTELISSESCYTLKVLNMNNQGLGHQGCRALVKAMKTARLNSNKKGLNLEVFIAGRNRLENEGMEMLSEVFGDGMTSLKKLVLLQNGIGIYNIRGVESLIVAIRNHVHLQHLNISDNTIKSNGMSLLSNVLPEFSELLELYMDDCLLKSQGARLFSLLAEDESICPNLKVVSLAGNEIKGSDALLVVESIIGGKKSIEKIDLRENEISNGKFLEIKEMLNENGKSSVLLEEEIDEEDDEEEEEESSEEESSEGEEEEEEEEEENSESNEENDSFDKEENNKFITESENEVEECSIKKEINIFNTPVNNNTVTASKSIFSTPSALAAPTRLIATPSSGLFSSSSSSKTSNVDISSSQSTASSSLFSFPTTTKNIFSTPISGLFSPSTTTATSSNLFSSSQIPAGSSTSLFSTPASGTSSNLFATANKTQNIFANKTLFANVAAPSETRPFSFFAAAKSNPLKEDIVACLSKDSLMAITKSSLSSTSSESKDSFVKTIFDESVKIKSESNVDKAIRVALILCDDSDNDNNFQLGLSIIEHLLTSSSTWSQATNSLLVEMDCIKSEEKRFVPLSQSHPSLPIIRVVKNMLNVERLPKEVKINLRTVLKNLTKMKTSETEDLLRELDNCMTNLSI